MIIRYLSSILAAIAPALGNHLWQSTLFAVVAGLLTLMLRRNHARARYWLWLAASVKFLIPFSLLVGIGSHLPWSRHSVEASTGLYFAMEQVSKPFTQPTAAMISQTIPATASPSQIQLLPILLTTVWLCGFVMVLFLWYARWRRISAAIRDAEPLREGREVETLRRLERMGLIRKRITMTLSRSCLEPGIFGIARPVLVWPHGISERLQDAHLEAILAHELSHVRRRDNLAAAMHMVVEAIFWFHPLVWWLGARLLEERECACDEEVLELGGQRQLYAEGILKVCEFCVGCPLACVSGVTGADLKGRIVRIMTQRIAEKLDFSRKLLLSCAGLVALAVPIVFGLLHATQSRAESQDQKTTANGRVYDVASIKPNKSGTNMVRLMLTPDGLSETNGTLQMLINAAYGVENNQISGAPNWVNTESYDIEAKMDSSTAEELRKLSEDERRTERQRMLQALLAERFKLTVRRESKELPIYALVVAKDGPNLQEAKPGDTYPNGIKGPDGQPGAGMMMMGREGLTAQGIPIANLVRHLSRVLGRKVVDKTGLTGKYDFTLKWTPDQSQSAMLRGPEGGQPGTGSAAAPEASEPSIFTALQEQLGLKLDSQKGPVEILIIDHVEKPSEN
jgi:uncharacterized protein (TIGR03435 family)